VKKLLALAEVKGWQAEVYWVTRDGVSLQYRLGEPVAAFEDRVDMCAIRVIRDGKLGSACGTVPTEDLLLAAAEAALRGGEATFSFAGPSSVPEIAPPNLELARVSTGDLLPLGDRVARLVLEERPGLPLMVGIQRVVDTIRIFNTEGLEREGTLAYVTTSVGAPFREVGSSLWKTAVSRELSFPEGLVTEFLEWYGWGDEVTRPATGKLPVLLSPEAAFLLTMPLAAGLSGEALWQHTSPLEGKLGTQVLGESISLWDDPLRPDDPLARAFDDEGTPCQRRPLVEQGMLKGYLYDLRAAALLRQAPTGNGFKRALFGGGPWAAPGPWPARPVLMPGKTPWRELLSSLDRGLLVYGGMGFHSSNYLQGHFSIQALGFYVEEGKVKGRLSGTMMAGNVYRDFHGVELSKEWRELPDVVAPFMLIPGVQVAAQG
jgi:PmbA protein